MVSRVAGRWWPPGIVVLAAVAFLVTSDGPVSIVMAVLLLAYGVAISPVFFPRSADLRVALRRAAAGQAPLVFWKPGCVHCVRLRVGLGRAGRRVSWVDSSLDPKAAAVVRSENGGNHTTPTVVFGDEARTNPDAGWVRSLLR